MKNSVINMDCVSVMERKVYCDGGDEFLGHPKVFLEVKESEDSVECPYCGKKFFYNPA